MSEREYQILSYTDIQRINWFVADTVRDKGNTESSQYKLIALPILSAKRFLDMREEFKRNELYTSFEYELEGNDLVAILDQKMPKHPAYAVFKDRLEWYDVEWSDIVNYKDNPDANEIEYKLGKEDNRCVIKTNAVDKVDFLYQVIESLSNSKTSRYFKNTDFITVSKKCMPSSAMIEIINELDRYKLDLKHAEEDLFADAYMDLTGKFAETEGKKGGEFHTPSKLVKSCIELMPPKYEEGKSIKIGDITSGACTFMVYAAKNIENQIDGDTHQKKEKLNANVEFVTQEKSEWSLGLGEMNLLFHGYENHRSFQGNTITDWSGYIGDFEGKLDYIYANPPYGLKDYGFEYAKANATKEERWAFGVPNKSEGEYAFLLSVINLLNENGKALVVLPLGTLFKDSTQAIRQRLVENDWIEGIIGLPDKMFLTTSIPVCLWIINKNKEEKDKGKIYMVDASNQFKKEGKFNNWNESKTIFNYNKKINEKGFSEYVDLSVVKNNNYNLSLNKNIVKEDIIDEVDISILNDEIKNLSKQIFDFENNLFLEVK